MSVIRMPMGNSKLQHALCDQFDRVVDLLFGTRFDSFRRDYGPIKCGLCMEAPPDSPASTSLHFVS